MARKPTPINYINAIEKDGYSMCGYSKENFVDNGAKEEYHHACRGVTPSASSQGNVNVSLEVIVYRNVP